MLADFLRALVLGIVEGVTEFLPVSSTGHLLLVERFFNLDQDNFWKSFAVLIQLGAILAILVIYFGRLWDIATRMFSDPAAQKFSDRRAGGILARCGHGIVIRSFHQRTSCSIPGWSASR